MSCRQTRHISVAILAGGRNSRFNGQPKALIPWKGKPLIQYYLLQLQKYTDDLFVISNEPEQLFPFTKKVFPDQIAGRGPLSGIHAAVTRAVHPHVLVVACDMPFLPVALIPHLTAQTDKNPDRVIIPVHEKKTEPLFALWPSNLAGKLEYWLNRNNDLKILRFVDENAVGFYFDARALLHGDYLFFNINTPDDLRLARSMAVDRMA
ncbi:MAG: molybdenum cofactor guanylyltransferase [Bacteroidales bacterium]